MPDKVDTRGISLDEPIDEVFIKAVDIDECYSDMIEGQGADEYLHTIENSYPYQEGTLIDSQRNRSLCLTEWLAIATKKVSKPLLTSLVASKIDITRLSASNRWTAPIDSAAIVNICQQYHSFIVSVSPSLITSREKVQASSLLSLSGAYLTWMEMLGDDLDDEE